MNKQDERQGLQTNNEALAIGARLECGPSERLTNIAFARELDDQLPLNDAISLVDLAHTLCTIECGVIPRQAGAQLLRALVVLNEKPASFEPTPDAGDLYTNREAWLANRTDAVDWFGCGRARREATTTAYLLLTRSRLLDLSEAIVNLASGAVAVAANYQDTLMPDYTYLQAAQPTCFGHYLLGFVYPMLRDMSRLRALFDRVNASPMGCGSTNGSRIDYDRQKVSDLLGFDHVSVHTRDAMWQSDVPIELSALLTACIVNIDRLAEDLQVFATQEFGLVELCDSHSRASKIMPQKKNPFALTYIRGVANEIIGTTTSLSMVARTPSGQPDNRSSVYGRVPSAINLVANTLHLMGEVLSKLKFNRLRGEELTRSQILATDLADVLVLEAGLPPRSAHRLVGKLVRENTGELTKQTVESISVIAEHLFGRTLTIKQSSIQSALEPREAIAARKTLGGAGHHAMAVMLEQCLDDIGLHREWHDTTRNHLLHAEVTVIERAKKIMNEQEA